MILLTEIPRLYYDIATRTFDRLYAELCTDYVSRRGSILTSPVVGFLDIWIRQNRYEYIIFTLSKRKIGLSLLTTSTYESLLIWRCCQWCPCCLWRCCLPWYLRCLWRLCLPGRTRSFPRPGPPTLPRPGPPTLRRRPSRPAGRLPGPTF